MDKEINSMYYKNENKNFNEMEISAKNHTDVLIFRTQICAGASQICLMAGANWTFAPPRR